MSTTKTLTDCVDDFDERALTAQSLLSLLELQILDVESTCGLGLHDPHHPVQQMHALVVSVRHQLNAVEKIVRSMPDIGKATP
jgi:hypothetical protein